MHRVLQGEPINWSDAAVVGNGNIAVTSREKEIHGIPSTWTPWVISERERVGTDRLGGAAEGLLFFFGLQFFAPECGLFFFADLAIEQEKTFEAVLNFLGDTGLGADRNSGLGHFEFQRTELPSFQNQQDVHGRGAFLLSLCNPDPQEDVHHLIHLSAYDLTTRSGWISGTTLGRPPVRAFAEGSFLSGNPVGRVLPLFDANKQQELNIAHAAPRDFRAFVLPCTPPEALKGDQ
jgi:CRISPR-associated protein Csm4